MTTDLVSRTEQPIAVRDAESEALSMIERAARDSAVDIVKFERLVALRNQERAFLAEQRFNEAMNEVQALNLRVPRSSRNAFTNSTYAKLEALNQIVVPAYSARGFSLSFGTADCPLAGHYRLVCTVSNSGHTKQYQCDIPTDTAGLKGGSNKNAVQGFGSTMTYGRRYLTKLIFNVVETDEDDDGQGASQQKPQGPNSLMSEKSRPDSPDVLALKRKLVDMTRSISLVPHGYKLDDSARARINQYCWDEAILSDTESLNDITATRLTEVVNAVERKLSA